MELFGQPVARLRDRWRVGYVPQRHANATGLPTTVGEVVACGRLPGCGPGSASAEPTASTWPQPSRPSGWPAGSAPRCSSCPVGSSGASLIARALAAEADLLVLDEPTAGVDAASQRALADTVERLADGGATILYITHEPGPVAHLAPARSSCATDGSPTTARCPGAPEHGDDHHHHTVPAATAWFGTD